MSLFFMFESCDKDSSVESNQSSSENQLISEKDVVFGDSFIMNLDDPFQDGAEINLTEQNVSFANFLLELDELQEELLLNNPSFIGVDFEAQNVNGNLIISNLVEVYSGDSDNLVASCPPGMETVKTCRNKQCVENTLQTIAGKMQSGDSFSVHRKTLGVTICANSRLKNDTFPYNGEGDYDSDDDFGEKGDDIIGVPIP
ncbi:hypothetical protein GCM10022291_13340 [Postechiella marina]|uniref:Uncharacterized protein n=2 Tax=Postechiella marina TaxID=943941 RepID=A0ABP8C644_9FLAO